MTCNRCGSANDVGARFCNNCAAPLKVPEGAKSQTWKWVLGILGGMCILSGIFSNLVDRKHPSSPPNVSAPAPAPSAPSGSVPSAPARKSASISASVTFTGSQFIITNKDTYNWTSVKMEINGGLFSGGYELKQPLIKAGETYTVGALQFADSDGTRFNPFQMKPKKFSICGTTPNGFACYVGGWD